METRPMTEKNKPKNEPQDIVSEILKSDMVTDFFFNILHWKRTFWHYHEGKLPYIVHGT